MDKQIDNYLSSDKWAQNVNDIIQDEINSDDYDETLQNKVEMYERNNTEVAEIAKQEFEDMFTAASVGPRTDLENQLREEILTS